MSGERGKEKVEIVDQEVEISVDLFYHKHPLTLGVIGERSGRCCGCRRYIYPAETAYTCREGCSDPILHEECAEMPREIRMSMHPQHTLIQKEVWYVARKCAICEKDIYWIGYYCTSLDRCEFQVHVGCAQNMGITPSYIDHPSHPHQLMLLWRPGRSCLSRCDACGTIEKGSSYICTGCQYWIHESCASLPATTDNYPHHHHHPLSLIYHLPLEYIKYDFTCDICLKDLLPRYWAYHCATCRYVVHIKCAISTTTMNIDANAVEDKDVIVFPINNAEEMIRSFVSKVGGAMPNPNENMVNGKYKFHSHHHQLLLTSSSLNHQEDDEEEEYNNYDDGVSHGELVCDGCTMPIFPNKQKSSSSSSSSVSEKYYYMSCGECKYFLHWACFHLPPELPSPHLHLQPDHNLTLQTSPKLDFTQTQCEICHFCTNGLFYGCTKSDFEADIKCASLPNTIKHEAHPRHLLKLLSKEATSDDISILHTPTIRGLQCRRPCGACGGDTYSDIACYICEICKFVVHSTCALLPAVVSNPEWDKHPLPLTFDASADHPSDFYCDICEQKMNPKSWMYHCRTCDFSLHPLCYPAASGYWRNIKFGQRYDVASVHHHPLRYQLLTTKLNCGVCGKRQDYGSLGFQCTSHNCDFFMCYFGCYYRHRRKALMQAVD